jgi:hypothetical protein
LTCGGCFFALFFAFDNLRQAGGLAMRRADTEGGRTDARTAKHAATREGMSDSDREAATKCPRSVAARSPQIKKIKKIS